MSPEKLGGGFIKLLDREYLEGKVDQELTTMFGPQIIITTEFPPELGLMSVRGTTSNGQERLMEVEATTEDELLKKVQKY